MLGLEIFADCLKFFFSGYQGLTESSFYIIYNGRIARGEDFCNNGSADVVLRLPGGKGGFGSMLRAIGAQIEKTTNREACRDLSGRRLRDINEEKRLKSWIDKQATREEEAVERRKKKLERLCAQPKHEFKDKNYEIERSSLTEKVGDAVEEGFKLAMEAGGSGAKRKHENKAKRHKQKLILDLDIDSDELGSSSEESDSDSTPEKRTKLGSSISVDDQSSREEAAKTETDDRGSEKSIQSDTGIESNGSDRSEKSSADEKLEIASSEVGESGKEVAIAL